MNTIVYTYRGQIEVGTGGRGRPPGYSETKPDGAILYPWMTAAECRADARARGAVAVFRLQANRPPVANPEPEEP